MGNFIELKTLEEATAYVQKNSGLEPGSNELTNLKYLFNQFQSQSNMVLGVIRSHCPFCNELGDGGTLTAMERDSEQYKKLTSSDDIPTMMCGKCVFLSGMLSEHYKLDQQAVQNVLKVIKEEKAKGGQ